MSRRLSFEILLSRSNDHDLSSVTRIRNAMRLIEKIDNLEEFRNAIGLVLHRIKDQPSDVTQCLVSFLLNLLQRASSRLSPESFSEIKMFTFYGRRPLFDLLRYTGPQSSSLCDGESMSHKVRSEVNVVTHPALKDLVGLLLQGKGEEQFLFKKICQQWVSDVHIHIQELPPAEVLRQFSKLDAR